MGGHWRLLALLFAMLAIKDDNLREKMSLSPSLTKPYNVPWSENMTVGNAIMGDKEETNTPETRTGRISM